MKHVKHVWNEKGLSLVEVVVGSVIVGIACIGVALMFSTGQAYIDAEGDNRVALYLAQQHLEKLRAMGHAGIMNLSPLPPRIDVEATITDYPGYRRTTSLICRDPKKALDDITGVLEECLPTLAFPEDIPMVEVLVVVTTNPSNRKARSVSLRTALAYK